MWRAARWVSNAFRRAALSSGYLAGRARATNELRSLISSLWPVETSVPLIRVGGGQDGGYLVPDDLEGVQACFSPGVADRVEFELDIVRRGIPCFLIDGSIGRCPVDHPHIDFEAKFLDGNSADDRYTLADWLAKKVPENYRDLLLQIDIEGYEYPSLLAASAKDLERFRIIVMEVHNLENIFTAFGFRQLKAFFEKLHAQFHLVHNHPNNVSAVFRYAGVALPNVMELTFLRRDRAEAIGPVRRLPHPLDRPCLPKKRELALGQCLWPNPLHRERGDVRWTSS